MRSILIVEDEELELEFIEAVIHEELQLEDIVITANTGAQAVRQEIGRASCRERG